jgi:hypothetical protein
MGAVFLGVDPEHRIRRAIKVVLAGADDRQRAARFQREVELVARLAPHPNLVKVHATGSSGPLAYAVLDWIDGEPMSAAIERGQVEVSRSLDWVEQVARGLGHAHAAGIIHRDVKPSNILIRSDDGAPVVIDFGLARAADAQTLTKTGTVLGTVHYMSPEQLSGARDVDDRADVWSLGVVLHELLTGELPFEGESMLELMGAISSAEPPAPSSARPLVSRDVDAVVARALAKDPRDRYPSALALAEDVRRARLGEPVLARSRSARERLAGLVRRRAPALAVAAVGVVALAVGIAVLSRREESGPPGDPPLVLAARALRDAGMRTRKLDDRARDAIAAARHARSAGQEGHALELEALDLAAKLGGESPAMLEATFAAARRALGLSPNDDRSVTTAEAAMRAARYDEALAFVAPLLGRQRPPIAALRVAAATKVRAKRFADAELTARAGLALDPNDAHLNLALGRALRGLSRTDEALRPLSIAERELPQARAERAVIEIGTECPRFEAEFARLYEPSAGFYSTPPETLKRFLSSIQSNGWSVKDHPEANGVREVALRALIHASQLVAVGSRTALNRRQVWTPVLESLEHALSALTWSRPDDDVPLVSDAWGAATLARMTINGDAESVLMSSRFMGGRMSRAGRFAFGVGIASYARPVSRNAYEERQLTELLEEAIGLAASSDIKALLSTDARLRADYRTCLQRRASELWRAASGHPQSSVPDLERALRLADEAHGIPVDWLGFEPAEPIFDSIVALLLLGRLDEADRRLAEKEGRVETRTTILRADLLLRRGRNDEAAVLFRRGLRTDAADEIPSESDLANELARKGGLALALARKGDIAGARAVLAEIRQEDGLPWLPWFSRDLVEKEIARTGR